MEQPSPGELVLKDMMLRSFIDVETTRTDPPKLFRLCSTNKLFNEMCSAYRNVVWTKYMTNDIFPYFYAIDDARYENLSGYRGESEYRQRWLELHSRMMQDGDASAAVTTQPLTNASLYTFYQEGISHIITVTWFWSERLRDIIRNPGSLSLEDWGIKPEGQAETIDRLMVMTGGNITQLIQLLERNSTKAIDLPNIKDPLIKGFRNGRKVLNFMEFAVYSGNTDLLKRIVNVWSDWFYSWEATPNGVDLLNHLTDHLIIIARDAEKLEDRNRKDELPFSAVHQMIQAYIELFLMPTMKNPKGRFSKLYSEEVKEKLQPVMNREGEYIDLWHLSAANDWESSLKQHGWN